MTKISFEADSNLEEIAEGCFKNAKALIEADLSNCKKLKNIPKSAFYKSGLETILLPENGLLTDIHAGSFAYTSISTISIPDTVTTLWSYIDGHEGMFTMCSKLTTVKIKASSHLEYIGNNFAQKSGILSFYIPKSVKTIAEGCFSLIYSLKTINVDPENENFEIYKGILYTKGKINLVFCPCNISIPIEFSGEVNIFFGDAFRGCRREDELIIPNFL